MVNHKVETGDKYSRDQRFMRSTLYSNKKKMTMMTSIGLEHFCKDKRRIVFMIIRKSLSTIKIKLTKWKMRKIRKMKKMMKLRLTPKRKERLNKKKRKSWNARLNWRPKKLKRKSKKRRKKKENMNSGRKWFMKKKY